jgi:hypothetical protein
MYIPTCNNKGYLKPYKLEDSNQQSSSLEANNDLQSPNEVVFFKSNEFANCTSETMKARSFLAANKILFIFETA